MVRITHEVWYLSFIISLKGLYSKQNMLPDRNREKDLVDVWTMKIKIKIVTCNTTMWSLSFYVLSMCSTGAEIDPEAGLENRSRIYAIKKASSKL
jgi:hypothetical protein